MNTRNSPIRPLLCLGTLLAGLGQASIADEPTVEARVAAVIRAVGGEANRLRVFRMKDRINVSSDPAKPGSERVSFLEPPAAWWLGKTERVADQKEPAIFLVWAWTLGALVDPASKVEAVPDVTEGDRPAFGLRVSGTINPPMELYFDKADDRLVRVDWRSDVHRFSDWKESDGAFYPSKCVGHKKATGKPWYFSEVLEIERLRELPERLKRETVKAKAG